jgi:beta-phosphoglucomutase
MERIKAVIFDLEGVVVDSEPVWTHADLIFLKNHGIEMTFEEYEAGIKHLLMGLVLRDGITLMKQHYGLPEDPVVLAEERRAIVKSLFSDEVTYIPGFSEFHGSIRDIYPTAVATSLERYFLTPLDGRLALSQQFNGNLHSVEDIGFISKPDPAIFLHAAKGLGINSRDYLVIEDAPKGVEAAKRAGMKCVALTTSSPRERLIQADLVVNSYKDIDLRRLV